MSRAARDVIGNRRLTSVTGLVLVLLLAVEGVTILRIHALLNVHVIVGSIIIAPVALKLLTTGYRFVRYYLGDASYVAAGPPPAVLRVLGPIVIVLTVALLGTGLLVLWQPGGPWLFLHKATFFAWFVVMTVHVLGHLRSAIVESRAELHGGRVAALRAGVLVAVLVVGVGVAAAVYPSAATWIGNSGSHNVDVRGSSDH